MRSCILFVALIILTTFAFDSAASNSVKEEDGDSFESKDSLKPINKNIFSFNVGADKAVIKPAAKAYSHVPQWGRKHVSNFLTNLNEPKNFVNGVLQGKPGVALPSFWRFFVNSTIGLGGVNDVATGAGLKYQDQNFSKTLASYGVKNGNYVVLPLLGPSTERNTVGQVADWVLNPIGWVAPPVALAQAPVDGIATRDKESAMVDQLYYESMDPYAATRSAYMQNQEFKH